MSLLLKLINAGLGIAFIFQLGCNEHHGLTKLLVWEGVFSLRCDHRKMYAKGLFHRMAVIGWLSLRRVVAGKAEKRAPCRETSQYWANC